MDKTFAVETASAASIYWLQPGDAVNSPRGEPAYVEPRIEMPGWKAAGFMLKGQVMGILIIRQAKATLRYFDREGLIHDEAIDAAGFDGQMRLGTRRMAEIVQAMLGERHPLAEARSANRVAV